MVPWGILIICQVKSSGLSTVHTIQLSALCCEFFSHWGFHTTWLISNEKVHVTREYSSDTTFMLQPTIRNISHNEHCCHKIYPVLCTLLCAAQRERAALVEQSEWKRGSAVLRKPVNQRNKVIFWSFHCSWAQINMAKPHTAVYFAVCGTNRLVLVCEFWCKLCLSVVIGLFFFKSVCLLAV